MTKPSLRVLPAIIVLAFAAAGSLAVATVVEAQTPPTPSARPMPPDDHGMHHGPGMRMMKEVERLKTSLQLTAAQSALWDKAVAQMKPPTNLHEEMKADHERALAALADPNFNPRTMAAEMDRRETERHARMTATRDAWFAVYDSLNPAQRGQVREFLRERMSHRPDMHRGGWAHEREGEHGGMMHPKPVPDGTAPTR